MTAPEGLTGLAGLGLRALGEAFGSRLAWLSPRPVTFRAQGISLPLAAAPRAHRNDPGDLYRGRFQLAGVDVACEGRIVFEHDPGNEAWLAALHGFGWLHDLLDGRRQLQKVFARTLIGDWEERHGSLPPQALDPAVMALRVMHWIAAAALLLDGAEEGFARTFFTSLTWQTRRLARLGRGPGNARARLLVRLALAHAAIGLRGLENMREAALARLGAELERQILPDGGHVSRNPARLVEIAAFLLPLRAAMETARLAVPPEMRHALERALPMVRFFRHGDGGLALFNGVSDPAGGQVAAILEADMVRGRPLSHAPHSGYGRLMQGAGLVIADVGRPPAPGLNPDAALSVAAFEFSHGPMRIITNCGAPRIANPAWQRAARLSRAHSCALAGEGEAGRIVDNALIRRLFGGPALLGPEHVRAELRESTQGSLLEVSHDAFAGSCGLAHARRLFLAPGGEDLRGEDRFTPVEEGKPAQPTPLVLRFHLHPSVDASMSRDGLSVMLRLADKSGWTFSARKGRVRLEESVSLASETGLRRSSQIVVESICEQGGETIKWFLRRLGEAPRKRGPEDDGDNPRLPL